MRDLGVGLVYWLELAPLFDAPGLVNVLELEPQTIWGKHEAATGPSSARLGALPQTVPAKRPRMPKFQ
jgi:hypothetical protein